MLNVNHKYKHKYIGYACRADKNPYRHDRRADKNPYLHDRRADKNTLSLIGTTVMRIASVLGECFVFYWCFVNTTLSQISHIGLKQK